MRLTILGSGTLLPVAGRGSAAHLAELPGATVLLDCGAGALQALARAEADWRSISHVVLTHFHTDHTGALPSLFWALRFDATQAESRGEGSPAPLTVLGPKGLRGRLEAMSRAFGSFVLEPGRPLQVVELAPGGGYEDAVVELSTHSTEHTDVSLAYRLRAAPDTSGADDPEGDPPVLGYTGDAGPTPGLGAFFRGVSLLISECATDDEDPRDGHLTPAGVADLAKEADCPLVVITHVYPEFDPESPGRCGTGGGGFRAAVLPVPMDSLWSCPGASLASASPLSVLSEYRLQATRPAPTDGSRPTDRTQRGGSEGRRPPDRLR